MAEFYDPMLYMSTPDRPNTMGVVVELKEKVDDNVLRDVVESLRVRFPYFYVKAVPQGEDLLPEENPLPMTVRNTWAPIKLGSQESNFHLAAWKYEGQRLCFEIAHTLTDGAGLLPYIKSAVFLYLSNRLGLSFDRTGFRLPGDNIPESETGNPFAGLDIDGAKKPSSAKEPIIDFYRLGEGADSDPRIAYIRLPEAQFMEHCKNNAASPNAFLAVMFARAVRHYDPASEETVSVSVSVDHKAMLGNYDNYRMASGSVELGFPKDMPLDDLKEACAVARKQLTEQAQPENSLWAMRQMKALCNKMNQVPLNMKLDLVSKDAGRSRWSIPISYPRTRTFGPLDPYIESLYMLSEPSVADVICEVTCINNSFFLVVAQSFASDAFLDVFLGELSSIGIGYEVVRKEPFCLCGMEPVKLV